VQDQPDRSQVTHQFTLVAFYSRYQIILLGNRGGGV